jgi:hypothetical protein
MVGRPMEQPSRPPQLADAPGKFFVDVSNKCLNYAFESEIEIIH